MIRPKQMVRMGAFYMHEAILDLLYESHQEGVGLGAADIGTRLGIYRTTGAAGMNDAIVTGFLNELHSMGKVVRKRQSSGRGGWALSPKEYTARRDDL